MNIMNQTELQMVDTSNLHNPCEINHGLTKPLVLFLNSRKEVLSSAPTSPNSSENETPGPISSIKFQYTKDSRKCFRKMASQTNWRKRQGMTLRCGPFFSRTHNGLINSPYQSDVSQSAPSSPTIDTYETLPLIPNASTTIDQGTEQIHSKPFSITGQSNLLHTESKNDEYKSLGTSCLTNNKVKYSESTLLSLMQRLGIQSVWPCLLKHGVVDVDRLSKLTRNELIEMGVTDAETRATLMTAAQLLTDSWLNPSLFHKTLNRSLEKNPKDFIDLQTIHDSGISSGTDNTTTTTHSYLTYKPKSINFCNNNTNELKHHQEDISSNKLERMEQHQSRWGYGQPISTEHNGSIKMISYEEIDLNMPIRQNVGSYQTMNSDKNSFQNVSRVFGEMQCQSQKHPVGILRNSRLSRDSQLEIDNVKRSSSTTPKTVKIDERFLLSSSRHQQQQKKESNLLNTPMQSSQTPSLSTATSHFVQYPQTNQHHISNSIQSINEDAKNVYIQHIYLARHILRKKLNSEHIDLTQPPYSDETGRANIPLRLIQRYSFETNLDLLTVAMALEAERDTNLREIRRPVISFNEEIRSQRFLNCDGIKTGSLQEFLITIGLPMYINHILHYNSINTNSMITNSNSTTTNNNNSSSTNSTNKHNHKCLLMTPADLLNMSNGQLQEKFNFLPIHIQWLRQEASVIPWILLGQTNSTKYSTMNNCIANNNNIYSLPRHSIMNNCCRRSSSQLRKLQQYPQQQQQQQQQPPPPPAPPSQQQQQQKRSTASTQPFNNHCQHYPLQDYHEGHEQSDHFINLEHLVDKV
uniref:SAM domain-containing protein n=1 Tax=Schistosoma mansoni TaxID=6183 RepID=A0A5K4FBC1_SCHMA